MTRNEAERMYIETFGGLPYFLLMGADDETATRKLLEAVKAGKEMEPDVKDADY